MAAGIRATGDNAIVYRERDYLRPVEDVAVFYGLQGNLKRAFDAYIAAGKPVVYIDLGYWKRKLPGGGLEGYHKVSVNDRHPTAYFRNVQHSGDRFAQLGVPIEPWRSGGDHILLAGLGAKAAGSLGLKAEEWERNAIAALRKVTDRPIIYRPKPSWDEARPIEGVGYSWNEPLEVALHNCHAVVTRHSNTAVDAILAGIPAMAWYGVAAPVTSQDYRDIEQLPRLEDRASWAADIAYTQWTVSEMRNGSVWRHLKQEALVP